MNYTEADAQEALEGHVIFPGTDVEVVAYRSGDQLTILTNKKGVCVQRMTITNAFVDLNPTSNPPLDPKEETFVVRAL